ncbi:MAG TPA: beta-N-acetylglucosaminidase domain-containing protein [Terriglobia bacterium]|nr:beta-N-acetylglucosaminidase domain-containing protein [Terriglobia bacterium]
MVKSETLNGPAPPSPDMSFLMGSAAMSFRRTKLDTAFFLFAVSLCAAVTAAAQGRSVWAIVSSAPVDPRVEAEVKEMAAAAAAGVVIARTETEARRRHPSFSLELVTTNERGFRARWPHGRPEPPPDAVQDAYRLQVDYASARAPYTAHRARIAAIGPDGLHNGLLRTSQILAELAAGKPGELIPKPQVMISATLGRETSLGIADFPSFAVRGIVEGFYGTPWSHQDRLDLLRFEGRHGMNSYFYAPKDDPYHRKQWRDPYPPDRLAQLGDLVAAAHQNFVDFCFAVSPGLSMTYSSDEDFAKLTAKLESVGKLGTSCYALFLDDVPQEIQNDADKARFKTLAEAHAYVINKLYHYLVALSPRNHLVVTPTTYTNGFGSRDYIRDLGAEVDPHVDLVWTGTEVVSPVITVPQTEDWSKFLKRPPLIWDNYPVDDFARWRPFLGPLVGRDPRLGAVVRGLVSNPMNEAHASMIPLATIADYLWNSHAYNPQESEKRALAAQFGPDGPQVFAPLLQAWGDYRWDSNVFQQIFSATRLPIDLPRIDQRIESIDSALGSMSGKPQFDKVRPELTPFAARTRERAQALAGDPAMRRLADGSIQWNEEHNVLTARRLAAAPALDGDFSKWQAGKVYDLRPFAMRAPGADSATANAPAATEFSGKFGLGWDSRYLYVGIDIQNPEIYRPPATENGGAPADDVSLAVETAYRREYYATRAGEDAFLLVANPGNFQGVVPSFRIVGRNRPARFANYEQEVRIAWKKTSAGYSADIAIPASYFDGSLQEGYEIGLLVGAQKLVAPGGAAAEEDVPRLRLTSKADHVIPPNPNNPATYQHLVLLGTP